MLAPTISTSARLDCAAHILHEIANGLHLAQDRRAKIQLATEAALDPDSQLRHVKAAEADICQLRVSPKCDIQATPIAYGLDLSLNLILFQVTAPFAVSGMRIEDKKRRRPLPTTARRGPDVGRHNTRRDPAQAASTHSIIAMCSVIHPPWLGPTMPANGAVSRHRETSILCIVHDEVHAVD
jgi:hypothetical protein